MRFMTRQFKFDVSITSKHGDVVKLSAIYDVEFCRFEDSRYTYITVKPDYAPPRKMKYDDVDITWGSIFYAYKWCEHHSTAHLRLWVEMDLQALDEIPDKDVRRYVIPEQKLSTIGG